MLKGIERDEIWTVYGEKAVSLEVFSKEVVPNLNLANEIPEGVRSSIQLVKKMLDHSYFEYQFIDVALTKLSHTFEMALRLRYNYLNGAPSKLCLKDMITWFFERGYFETDCLQYVDHIRILRNHLSHPEKFSLGGVAFLHKFDVIVDLINDVFMEPSVHQEHRREIAALNSVHRFAEDGGILEMYDKKFIIYSFVPMYILPNSRGKTFMGYCKLIFELHHELSDPTGRLWHGVTLHGANYKVDKAKSAIRSDNFIIRPIIKDVNKERFENWKNQYLKSDVDKVFDYTMDMQCQKEINQQRRMERVVEQQ